MTIHERAATPELSRKIFSAGKFPVDQRLVIEWSNRLASFLREETYQKVSLIDAQAAIGVLGILYFSVGKSKNVELTQWYDLREHIPSNPNRDLGLKILKTADMLRIAFEEKQFTRRTWDEHAELHDLYRKGAEKTLNAIFPSESEQNSV